MTTEQMRLTADSRNEKKIEENQAEYNQQMVHQTNKVKQAKLKEGDTVSIKIGLTVVCEMKWSETKWNETK